MAAPHALPRRLVHRRRAVAVLATVLATAAVALYANRDYSGDLYWLLAAGREAAHHGPATTDPFRTLNEGRVWYDQQWLTGILFYGAVAAGGLALLSLLYALLLAICQLPLVLGCRHRRPQDVALAWLLSLPILVAVLDPRAEGFSLLAFSVLMVLVEGSRRSRRVWLIPLVFALWANLHAAFLVGFLFLAAVALGALVDRRLGRRAQTFSVRFLAFGLALPAVLGTPLGARVVDYFRILSSSRLLPRITFEWDPTWQHPALLLYPLAVMAFATWLWRRSDGRPLEPLLVVAVFAVFAVTATRQLVWLGPICFYLVRRLGRPGRLALLPRRFVAPAAAAAAAAIVAWLAFVAPPPNERKLDTSVVDYLAAHPVRGRVATAAGAGSYLLWKAPHQRGTIDGRFENYSDAELSGSYDILAHRGHAERLIGAWRIRGIVTSNGRAKREYPREGWRVAYRERGAVLLVRQPR